MALSRPAVLAGYLTGDISSEEGAGGDHVVGCLHPTEGWAESSVVGAIPWYYTVSPRGELLQGPNVFDLCVQAGHAWQWNMAAIGQLAAIGHTLGTHTLHPKIFRMPSHSRIELAGGAVKLTRTDSLASWRWDEHELDGTFRTLANAFSACVADRAPMLSLSAGYDSRVLLALCLQAGHRPAVFTMGTPEATDVKVARLLAQRAGLHIDRVEISPDDYLQYGQEISRTTSGVKTAGDWHTWIYSKQVEDRDRVHLVGSNGEFARTYYSDIITQSMVFRSSGQAGVRIWNTVKMLNRLRKFPWNFWSSGPTSLTEAFHSPLSSADLYPKSALARMDTFYSIERVRHFIGSGLACYSQFTNPVSPFLDRHWMKEVAALRRPWKEDDRYHAAAVGRFAPNLIDIPFNQDPDGGATTSYSPFAALSRSSEVEELLIESRSLDFLFDRKARIRAMKDRRANRFSTVSFLLTMHFAGRNAQAIERSPVVAFRPL